MSSQEHFDKYEAMAQRIGIDRLIDVMPVPAERVRRALERGDEHLNSIPLRLWDQVAGYYEPSYMKPKMQTCPTCGHKHAVGFDRREFLQREPFQDGPHSAAERVCLLKHVATHHYLDDRKEV